MKKEKKERKFRHMTKTDRIRLEEKIMAGKSPQQAADELGFHVSTIYRELKRGEYEHLNSDYTTETRYSPDIGEERHARNMKAKGPAIKLGHDYALAEFIETKIADERYSPGAVLGEIKRQGLQFSVTLSKPTLYRYIEIGVFGRITNADLPEKSKKKRHKKKNTIKRAPRGESIENRPAEIDERNTFGNWEMDTVVSAGHADAAGADRAAHPLRVHATHARPHRRERRQGAQPHRVALRQALPRDIQDHHLRQRRGVF